VKTSVDELRELGPQVTVINVGRHAGSSEIRGAIRYRPDDLLTPEHLALPLPHDRPIVLYGENADDARVDEIAEKMRSSGYQDVRTLEGGFSAYKAADLPTQESSMEQVVPPMRPQQVDELDRRL